MVILPWDLMFIGESNSINPAADRRELPRPLQFTPVDVPVVSQCHLHVVHKLSCL